MKIKVLFKPKEELPKKKMQHQLLPDDITLMRAVPDDAQLKFKETYSGSRALEEYYRLNDPREKASRLAGDSLIMTKVLEQ